MRPALLYGALMVCLLAPVWTYDFLTQDGPAHLHNAEIIRQELAGHHHPAYQLRGKPIPNILGHLLLAALSTVAGPAIADKLVITLTCLAVGAAALALRWTVRGREGLIWAVPMAAFVASNRLWLLGFYSFLLGVMLFAIVIALAWRWKDDWTASRAGMISVLLLITYFAHPVSLGAAILGLAVIALRTSRQAIIFLGAAATPAAALMLYYVVYASSQAPMQPKWMLLLNLRVLTIANTSIQAAFHVAPNSPVLGTVTPAVLFAAAAVVVLINGVRPEQKTFTIITALFFALAFFGPEGLGNEHGNFMGQRLVLIAFISALPILEFHRHARLIGALALGAVLLQSGYLLAYGQRSQAAVDDFREAARGIPPDASVFPFVIKDDTRFRSSPELHASNLLGIGTQRVMWANYETEFYYFPVKYREPLAQCSEDELQRYRGLMVKAVNPKRAWMVGRFVCVVLANRERLDFLMTRGVEAKALVPWLESAYQLQPSPGGRPGLDLWKRRERLEIRTLSPGSSPRP